MEAVTITQISPPELQTLIENSLRKFLSFQTPPPQPESYITRQEAADMLHITLPTLLAWTMAEKLKGYRIGRRVLYKKNEINEAVISIIVKKKGGNVK